MADAPDSGSGARKGVWVQVPLTAGMTEKAGRETCLFYYGRGAYLEPKGSRSPRHKCLVGRFDGKKVH